MLCNASPIRLGNQMLGRGYPVKVLLRPSNEGPWQMRDEEEVRALSLEELSRECIQEGTFPPVRLCMHVKEEDEPTLSKALRRAVPLFLDVRDVLVERQILLWRRLKLTARAPFVFLEGKREEGFSHLKALQDDRVLFGVWTSDLIESQVVTSLGASMVLCDWNVTDKELEEYDRFCSLLDPNPAKKESL